MTKLKTSDAFAIMCDTTDVGGCDKELTSVYMNRNDALEECERLNEQFRAMSERRRLAGKHGGHTEHYFVEGTEYHEPI